MLPSMKKTHLISLISDFQANKFQIASELGKSMVALFRTVVLKFWLSKLIFGLWFHHLSCVAICYICMQGIFHRSCKQRYLVSLAYSEIMAVSEFHLLPSFLACFLLSSGVIIPASKYTLSFLVGCRHFSNGNCQLKQNPVSQLDGASPEDMFSARKLLKTGSLVYKEP